ncbi:homocysteine S-methyltransferase family protein [Sandaracinobacteroides hominis]|uniref:homocysteine S-methyltransferase family protein n=1 Tax=Sandaracinobacteroides hominis TaxID=2780086 RepID=UPI0018F5F8EC|nr:homocysteine S-methyltransferase family protein [Sandaracinobacteroides hominis]
MIAASAAETAFRALANARILVKDGPYGTAVQALNLVEADYRGKLTTNHDQKGNNDILNLTRPDAIAGIGRSYIESGADLLATNTFNANAISQADYGTEGLVREINLAAARILRAEIDRASAEDGRPRFLAGALGPTNKTLSLSPKVEDPGYREVDFDGMKGVYREQIDALLEGGVDFILIETVFDTLNAKAAAFAAMEAEEALGRRVPIMLSMTLTDLAGRNLSGQTVEAFWVSLEHVRPITIGLNCSFGATELRPHVQILAKSVDTLLMVYPNAGLPNEFGGYDELPDTTGRLIRDWAEAGLINAVGGCCGTTPAHIAAIAGAVAGLPPREPPVREPALRLSGLEASVFV